MKMFNNSQKLALKPERKENNILILHVAHVHNYKHSTIMQAEDCFSHVNKDEYKVLVNTHKGLCTYPLLKLEE